MIRYGSICSGIEAASMAWEPLGMRPAWFAEIEKFPSAVLAHHWPHVPNLGDMAALADYVATGGIEAPDVLVGGTPCQAFSVAGLRNGLDDERGQLTLEFVRLADAIDRKRKGDECVVVWENVPGVLTSKDNAFGCFLGSLAGEICPLEPAGRKWTNAGCVLGPKRAIAWRVLDAQHFGVAQRRRRVFVVASARDGFDPRKVLFESEGVRRDTPPSREAGQEVAGTLAARTRGGGYVQPVGLRMAAFGEYVDETASTMKARDYKDATDLVTCFDSRQDPQVYGNLAGPCTSAVPVNAVKLPNSGGVRRLTPTECERLQGFPDGHTRVPYRNKTAEDCPDGPRYKAIGNSKAVPVVRWIGARLVMELMK